MKLEKISFSMGKTIPHPYKQFANTKFDLELEVKLEENDKYEQSVESLKMVVAKEVEKITINILQRMEQDRHEQAPIRGLHPQPSNDVRTAYHQTTQQAPTKILP